VDAEVAAPSRVLDGHAGVAGDLESFVPATCLGVTPRQRDVEVAELEDLKAGADGLDATHRLEERAQPIGRHPEDLDVDVGRCAAHDPIAYPAAHEERAAARVAHRHGDGARL